ncbi:MAG: hypothetical protein KF830_02785 [Planctomycetes bacterium]|nr:hypothetical protein [Planctomycetota bacterium]
MPATARRRRTHAEFTVRLHGFALEALGPAAGIATYDAHTGADFAWTPLSAGMPLDDDAWSLPSATLVRGDLVVALASAPGLARHGYVARTIVAGDRGAAGQALVVDLRGGITTVRFELPASAQRAGPLRLVRCDDPQWLPTFHAATGIELQAGQPTALALGAGDYELIDPIAPERRQRFQVPASGPVVLSPTLAGARGNRP